MTEKTANIIGTISLIIGIICICLIIFKWFHNEATKTPIYKTYWYVDRGWRQDWKCSTKEEARSRAGNGRIYPEKEFMGYITPTNRGKEE